MRRNEAEANSPARCAERRRRLAAAMAAQGGGIAVLPTAPERQRNGDNDHPYRHCSHFHYLSGFDEPQAWLLLDDSGHSTLLCREKNAEREIWDGHRLGPEAAPAMLGVDEAHPVEALDRDRKSTRLNSSHRL